MNKHFKFVLSGALVTTLASYAGFFSLLFNQKIFIANYYQAFSTTFLLFFSLSLIIWCAGLLIMLKLKKMKQSLSNLIAFYLSSSLLSVLGLICFIIFSKVILNLSFNTFFLIFPGIPLLSAYLIAPFLIKNIYDK